MSRLGSDDAAGERGQIDCRVVLLDERASSIVVAGLERITVIHGQLYRAIVPADPNLARALDLARRRVELVVAMVGRVDIRASVATSTVQLKISIS